MTRHSMLALGLGVAVAAATLGAARPAHAQACIDDEARKAAAAACGGVVAKELDLSPSGRKPRVTVHAPPPPAAATPKTQTVTTGIDPRDDERLRRLTVRQKALLVTEIQGLERLFEGTPRGAADRPTLARRLAEDYAELEAVGFREKTEAEIERDRLKKTDPRAAGQRQAAANQADAIVKGARQKAIQHYALLVAEYPNRPDLDDALYYLAYEHEQAGDARSARAAYYDLVQKRPTSRWLPHAYLAFGEMFFAEAQGDPAKWSLAAQAYGEVIKHPPPANRVHAYARYKLAWVHEGTGDHARAVDAFKKVIDAVALAPGQPGAARLADAARRDVIPAYAKVGDPARAFRFFEGMGGDPLAMTADLGQALLDTGHYPEAIIVYRDLASRDRRGARPCLYEARIAQATMAMKGGAKEPIKAALEALLAAEKAARSADAPAEDKQRCANEAAGTVIETALSWHLEAIGTPGTRGTGDRRTMDLAAALYERAIAAFPAAELAKIEFSRMAREDWPTAFSLKYGRADLLFAEERWAEAAAAFDAALLEDPRSPLAPEAAYAAALSWQKVFEREPHVGPRQVRQGPPSFEPRTATPAQRAMLGAFDRYACHVKPAPGDKDGRDQLVEVKSARARTLFELQRWSEAAIALREVALDYADHPAAPLSAQLYLEALEVLRTQVKPARPSCIEDMRRDLPRMLDAFCAGDKAKGSSDCAIFQRARVDLARLSAEDESARARAATGAAALALHERAGTAYFELFRRHCEAPVAAGQAPEAERCDEIAENAARSYQAARLLAKAITARRALVDFDGKTRGRSSSGSPLARRAVYEVGASYQAMAVYDLAAEWYERFAKADPKAEKAEVALSDAVLLRLGLGQETEALEDARLFLRVHGATKPVQSAAIAWTLGAHYAEREEWEKARGTLEGAMPVIDRAAPDVQVQAHAAYARSLARLHREADARREYEKVRALWRDPAAAEAGIRSAYAGEDEAQKDKRLARALNAVGEAYFAAAEDARRARVDPLRFPEYHGAGSKADVLAHVGTRVKDWYEKKKAAIQAVEPEYAKILDLKPAAPPRWVIAAGARSGHMWGDLVDDFRRAPIPAAWRNDDELRNTYTTALYNASEPYRVAHARPALEKCLSLSLRHQYFDEHSRGCEAWLAKNYKAEYHVVDELRGAPTLINDGLRERAGPILAASRP